MLHDREPKAGAARGARAVGSVEALEQPREVGLVDAGAVVDDAEHDLAVRAAHREDRVGSRACVADRVLGQVPGDDAEHPRPHLGSRILVALDDQRHAGPRRLLLELRGDLVEHRQHRLGAERDDARPGLELGEEEHLVDQLDDLVDLAPCLLDELGHVLARQAGELEQREQPCERRSQLVRDGGGEARAQLLVRGEVAGLGEVDEPLRVGRRPGSSRRAAPARHRCAAARPAAARPPARRRATGAPCGWRRARVRLRRGRRRPRGSPRPAPGRVARRVPCSGSNRGPARGCRFTT